MNIWQEAVATAGGHALVGVHRGVGSEGGVGRERVLVTLLLLLVVM